jgi:hypothetical protein
MCDSFSVITYRTHFCSAGVPAPGEPAGDTRFNALRAARCTVTFASATVMVLKAVSCQGNLCVDECVETNYRNVTGPRPMPGTFPCISRLSGVKTGLPRWTGVVDAAADWHGDWESQMPRRDTNLVSAYWAGSNFFIVLNACFERPDTEATKIRMPDLCRSD